MKKIQGEPVPAIETRRLRLRGFTNDDLDALAAIYADPDVMRYMPGRKPVPRERVAASLGRMMDYWQQHGFGLWAVEDKESGRLIGRCGLVHLDNTPEIEVGYLFAAIAGARLMLRRPPAPRSTMASPSWISTASWPSRGQRILPRNAYWRGSVCASSAMPAITTWTCVIFRSQRRDTGGKRSNSSHILLGARRRAWRRSRASNAKDGCGQQRYLPLLVPPLTPGSTLLHPAGTPTVPCLQLTGL